MSLLTRFKQVLPSDSKNSEQSELSCKVQIQRADLSIFTIPKRKEPPQDVDILPGDKIHSKKHKKKKHRHHHHHHDNRSESTHITASHDSQTSQSDSPHYSTTSSPLRKLSLVIPKLNSSPVPTSSPLLTYNPVSHIQATDSEATKQDVSTAQTKSVMSTTESITLK